MPQRRSRPPPTVTFQEEMFSSLSFLFFLRLFEESHSRAEHIIKSDQESKRLPHLREMGKMPLTGDNKQWWRRRHLELSGVLYTSNQGQPQEPLRQRAREEKGGSWLEAQWCARLLLFLFFYFFLGTPEAMGRTRYKRGPLRKRSRRQTREQLRRQQALPLSGHSCVLLSIPTRTVLILLQLSQALIF